MICQGFDEGQVIAAAVSYNQRIRRIQAPTDITDISKTAGAVGNGNWEGPIFLGKKEIIVVRGYGFHAIGSLALLLNICRLHSLIKQPVRHALSCSFNHIISLFNQSNINDLIFRD